MDVEVLASDGSFATSYTLTVVPVDSRTGNPISRRQLGLVDSITWTTHDRAVQSRSGVKVGLSAAEISLDVGPERAKTAREVALKAAAREGKEAKDAADTPVVMPAYTVGMASVEDDGALVAQVASGGGCTTTYSSEHGPYYESFADFHGTAYAKGRIRHEYATTHTVGVAVKASGSSTWGSSGTATTSGSFSYDSGYYVVNVNVKNRIMEKYHYYTCYVDGKYYTTTYSKPSRVYDGPYYSQIAHVNYGTCSTAYANHQYSRISYKNETFTTGLDLPFGNFSAQAGWSSTQEMWWTFTRQGTLCGSNSQSWTTAPQVSANA